MYQEAFTKLELEDVATILDKLNPEFDGTVFDPVETTILAQDMNFYPGYRFLEVADHSSLPAMKRFVVYSDENHMVLNFSNEPIYAFNQAVPIQLSEDNISDYVRFFFTYVRGRHGRFLVTESVDDVNWRDDPPPAARKAVGGMLSPIELQNTDEQGAYILRVFMVFKDSLFRSLVKVEPNGFVSLSDEELLLEDMPVLDDTFGQ